MKRKINQLVQLLLPFNMLLFAYFQIDNVDLSKLFACKLASPEVISQIYIMTLHF